MDHKLKTYIKATKQSYRDFGATVGLSGPSVSDIVNRKMLPSLITAWNIEQATRGKVRMQDCVPVEAK